MMMEMEVGEGEMSAYKQQEMEEKNGRPCFKPNIQPQKPARDGGEKWTPMFQAQYSIPKTSKRWRRKMDPHVSGPIFDPKNQQEMEEKNGPPWSRPDIGPQKPAKDGRLKWTPHGPGPISPRPPKQKNRGKNQSQYRVGNSWSLGCGLTAPGEDISII